MIVVDIRVATDPALRLFSNLGHGRAQELEIALEVAFLALGTFWSTDGAQAIFDGGDGLADLHESDCTVGGQWSLPTPLAGKARLAS